MLGKYAQAAAVGNFKYLAALYSGGCFEARLKIYGENAGLSKQNKL